VTNDAAHSAVLNPVMKIKNTPLCITMVSAGTCEELLPVKHSYDIFKKPKKI
jgi:hypothetical protein